MPDNKDNIIGAIFQLDVSSLKEGLAEANKEIALANSKFKAATAGMDDWKNSSEGLTAKMEQLNAVVDLQERKLKGIQAEYDRVSKSQGEDSEAAKRLQKQLYDQQAVVDKAKKEQKEFGDRLEIVTEIEKKGGNAAQELGKKTKQAGEDSKSAGAAFQSMAVAIGNLIADGIKKLVSSLVEAIESSKELRKELSKIQTAFSETGLSAEQTNKAFIELNSVLGNEKDTTKALQLLGSMVDSEEELANYTNILTGVYAKFGDSIKSDNLAKAIKETTQLGTVQGVLGDALEWSGVNLDEYNAHLATMTSEEERNAYIQSTLNDLYGESANKYKELNASMLENEKATSELALVWAEVGAILEPLQTEFTKFKTQALEAMLPVIKEVASAITQLINGDLKGALGTITEVVNGISTKLGQELPKVITTLVKAIPDLIMSSLPAVLETVFSIVEGLMAAIPEVIETILTNLVPIIDGIVGFLLNNIPRIIDAAVQLLLGIVKAIPVVIIGIIGALPQLITTIVNGLVNALPQIVQAAVELFSGLIKAIPLIIAQLITELPTITATIVQTLLESIPELIECGFQLIQGLIQGMLDPQAIWEGIKQIGKGIVDGFKKFFGIKSPSRLMRDEVGEFLGLGITEGLEESSKNALKSVKNIGGTIKSGLADQLTGLEAGVNLAPSMAGATGGSVNNSSFTQIINAPKQPSRLELYRQTKNLLALKGGN